MLFSFQTAKHQKCNVDTDCNVLTVALLWPPYVIGGHYIFAL